MLPIAIAVGGLIGVISGYKIGSNVGKDAYIDDKLGLNHKSEGYNKDGKYWYGITKWLDKRDNKEYTLLTGRSNSGELVSALNNATIINHQIRNANQQTVPNHHVKARNYVFKKLRENFTEEGVKELKALFPIL